jgi:hypothetical protein
MTAYVVTCHKMQGGECPVIVIILHESHRAMLYREWLYTAVTRASQKCILLFKEDALRTALNKQKMKGSTLKQKILSFAEQQGISIEGLKTGREAKLPVSYSTRNRILDREDVAVTTPARLTTDAERSGGLMALLNKQREQQSGAKPTGTRELSWKSCIAQSTNESNESTSPRHLIPTVIRQPTVDGGM